MTPENRIILQLLHGRGPLTPDEIYLLTNKSGPWLYSGIAYLREKGLVDADLPEVEEAIGGVSPDTKISITQSGEEALYDCREARQQKQLESTRYWITTGIALAALAIAIISIILQYR